MTTAAWVFIWLCSVAVAFCFGEFIARRRCSKVLRILGKSHIAKRMDVTPRQFLEFAADVLEHKPATLTSIETTTKGGE